MYRRVVLIETILRYFMGGKRHLRGKIPIHLVALDIAAVAQRILDILGAAGLGLNVLTQVLHHAFPAFQRAAPHRVIPLDLRAKLAGQLVNHRKGVFI